MSVTTGMEFDQMAEKKKTNNFHLYLLATIFQSFPTPLALLLFWGFLASFGFICVVAKSVWIITMGVVAWIFKHRDSTKSSI